MLIDLPKFTLGKQCSAVAAAIIFLLVDVDVAMVRHGSESKGPSLLQVGENDIFEPFKWRIFSLLQWAGFHPVCFPT
jgi:hypothetical protein